MTEPGGCSLQLLIVAKLPTSSTGGTPLWASRSTVGLNICTGPSRIFKGQHLLGRGEQKPLNNILWFIHPVHRLLLVSAMVRSRRARGRVGTVFILQYHTRRTDCTSQTMTRREEYCSYMTGIGMESCWVLTCAQRRFVEPKNQYGSITTTWRPSWMQLKEQYGTTWPIPSSPLCVPLSLYTFPAFKV